MYWRIKSVTPEQLMRQYGVHIALAISLLVNVVLFFTRPNSKAAPVQIKTDFDNFARKVTRELLDSSYISFEQSTFALLPQANGAPGDLAPSLAAKMRQSDKLPKTADEMKATLKTLTDQRQVSSCRIDSVNQQDPNSQGLIPIDVQGVVAIHSAEESEPLGPVPFHLVYLVGLTGTPPDQKPIVADIQETH